jgi:hypothetical protein
LGGTGSRDGVFGIGLSVPASALAIGTVHLDHPDALGVKVPGESGPVGAGALDAEQLDGPEAPQPGQQLVVAPGRGRKGLDSEERSAFVQGGCNMHVEVRVDPASDLPWQSGHGHPFVPIGWGGTTSIGTMDKTAMGLCGRLL